MFRFDVDSDVLVAYKAGLDKALLSDDKMLSKVRAMIRKEVKVARDRVAAGIVFQHGDPRGARGAVRRSVYKQILGGNLNIYNSRRAGSPTSYEPERRLRAGQRGGNRVPRGATTERMMRYGGKDRGFVLRWLNDGTQVRTSRFGHRGSIVARHWFMGLAGKELEQAAVRLAALIEEEVGKVVQSS